MSATVETGMPSFGGESGQYVAVAGVVTASADDLPTPRLRISLDRVVERGLRRARHQRIPANRRTLDRGAVDSAHVLHGVDDVGWTRFRQIAHSGDYTDCRRRTRCMSEPLEKPRPDARQLAERIRGWGDELGFQQIGFGDIDLAEAESRLAGWLRKKFHGEMSYMERHGLKRSRPDVLVPGTLSVISARMDYLPEDQRRAEALLDHASKAYISRYALGRDYHKVLRGRLRALARRIEAVVGEFGYRVFVDSAPVLEKPLAEKAGLGWIGKHTNLINRDAGSWFFLGELYTDLPLPADAAERSHCGTCRACIDVCPTGAIVRPYELDARRCISYLTIELKGAIPEPLRKLVGNRVYGCDDCQIFCPWNKFARPSSEEDFSPPSRPRRRRTRRPVLLG